MFGLVNLPAASGDIRPEAIIRIRVEVGIERVYLVNCNASSWAENQLQGLRGHDSAFLVVNHFSHLRRNQLLIERQFGDDGLGCQILGAVLWSSEGQCI